MKITINVTQAHIDCGVQANTVYCPIALALGELLHPDVDYRVEIPDICLHPMTSEQFEIKLPAAAEDFIMTFDSGMSVSPFSFTLDLPTDHLRTTPR